jgi:hypothetical protein
MPWCDTSKPKDRRSIVDAVSRVFCRFGFRAARCFGLPFLIVPKKM